MLSSCSHCVCLGRGGKKSQSGGRLGKTDHGELEPCVWVLVPQRMEIPHPSVQGLSVYWPREGSCQAWEIYNRSFQPWPMWNKQMEAHNTPCASSAFARGSRTFPPQWQGIQNQNRRWGGATQRWKKCGKWPGDLRISSEKRSRLHNPVLQPRVWKSQHWSHRTLLPKFYQPYHKLGISALTPQNEWALLTSPSRMVNRKVFGRIKSARPKQKEFF